MPDYTYTRPTDPAAAEAELVEALHAQAAPVVDLEYTYDAPPVRLVRACELDTLRAERDSLAGKLNDVRAMLESMTPGGSEFADSPERCIAWVVERISVVGLIALERNNLRAELDALRQQRDALDADSRQAVRVIADLRGQVDAMRADLDLLAGWLDAVTNGLSVQELAQLADVAAEVRGRWGLAE